MAEFSGEIEVDLPRERVWAFVKDIDNWAHLFPGHQRHLEVEKDHFFWQLRGEAGVWSRLVEFDITVTEWAEPESVRFALKGRTEPVVGSGMCFTRPLPADPGRSTVGFTLDAHATGATAPMINMLLKKFVSEQSGPFLDALSGAMADLAPAGDPAAPAGPEPSSAPVHGPGVLVVTYRAPRTTECERWLGEHYVAPLWSEGSLVGYRRLERAATGTTGAYHDVLDTMDLPATLRHLKRILADIATGAKERGVVFDPDVAPTRMIARRSRSAPRRLWWRLRRWR